MIVIKKIIFSIFQKKTAISVILVFFVFGSVAAPICYNAFADQEQLAQELNQDNLILLDQQQEEQSQKIQSNSIVTKIIPSNVAVVFDFPSFKLALTDPEITKIHLGADINVQAGGAIINPQKTSLVIDGTNPYGETYIVQESPTPLALVPASPDQKKTTATPEVIPTATPEVIPTATPEVTPTATPEVIPTATPEVIPTTTLEGTPTTTPEDTPNIMNELYSQNIQESSEQSLELVADFENQKEKKSALEENSTLILDIIQEETDTPENSVEQTSEPTAESTIEPGVESTSEATAESTIRPTPQLTPEFTPENTNLPPEPTQQQQNQGFDQIENKQYDEGTIHTLYDFPNAVGSKDKLRVMTKGTLEDINFQNIIIQNPTPVNQSRDYIIHIESGVRNINQKFDNVEFYGEQLVRNPYGTVWLKDLKVYKKFKSIYAFDLVNAASVVLEGDIYVSSTGTQNAVRGDIFYTYEKPASGELGGLKVLPYSNVKIDISNERAQLFSIYNDGEFIIGEGANVEYNGVNAFANAAFVSRSVIEKDATLKINLQKNNDGRSIINPAKGGLNIKQNATVEINAPMSSSAPMIYVQNGDLIIEQGATLKAISTVSRTTEVISMSNGNIYINDPKSVIISSPNSWPIKFATADSNLVNISAQQINYWESATNGGPTQRPSYTWRKANGDNIEVSGAVVSGLSFSSPIVTNYVNEQDATDISLKQEAPDPQNFSFHKATTISIGRLPLEATHEATQSSENVSGTTDSGAFVELYKKDSENGIFVLEGSTTSSNESFSITPNSTLEGSDIKVKSYTPFFISQSLLNVQRAKSKVVTHFVRVGTEEIIGQEKTDFINYGVEQSVTYDEIDSYKPVYYKIKGDDTKYSLLDLFKVLGDMEITVYYASSEISVEVPTQILFTANEVSNGIVSSPKYLIKNNSDLGIKVSLEELKVADNQSVQVVKKAQNNNEIDLKIDKVNIFTNSIPEIIPNTKLAEKGFLGNLDGRSGLVSNQIGEFSIGGKYIGTFSEVAKKIRVNFVFKLEIDSD